VDAKDDFSADLTYARDANAPSDDFVFGDFFPEETHWSTQIITLPYTGKYLIRHYQNWGATSLSPSVDDLPRTIRKMTYMSIKLDGVPQDIAGTTILFGDDPLADLNLSATFVADAGVVLQTGFKARHDMPLDVGIPYIGLTSEVYFVGPN
jgi:hypothetical protein